MSGVFGMRDYARDDVCALCERLLPRTGTPQVLTVGREGERVHVCEDSSACRRRAIELVRAQRELIEKAKLFGGAVKS